MLFVGRWCGGDKSLIALDDHWSCCDFCSTMCHLRLHRRWSISGQVSRLVIVPSPRVLLQLRPCTCRYPLIFTLWYTKIKGLHKTGKLKTGKNICPLFRNIRNGNTQKWEIRENCHTEKLAIQQYYYGDQESVFLSPWHVFLVTIKLCSCDRGVFFSEDHLTIFLRPWYVFSRWLRNRFIGPWRVFFLMTIFLWLWRFYWRPWNRFYCDHGLLSLLTMDRILVTMAFSGGHGFVFLWKCHIFPGDHATAYFLVIRELFSWT